MLLLEKFDINLCIKKNNTVEYNWKDKVILIAEDMEMNFVLLKKTLQQTKANIIRAKNGKEMLDIVKSDRHVDIVLLDMGMPVMDGYEATKLLRNEGFDVPIIAQTAFALDNEKERVLQAGCNDYVEKPIKKEVLFEKINKLIR